jgi:hypothetical protein
MDQKLYNCRPVLLIGRHVEIELHCADYELAGLTIQLKAQRHAS